MLHHHVKTCGHQIRPAICPPTAAGAAARVGYESASQFNREFKRLFGRSPGEEARKMRTAFALMEPAQLEAATSTH